MFLIKGFSCCIAAKKDSVHSLALYAGQTYCMSITEHRSPKDKKKILEIKTNN